MVQLPPRSIDERHIRAFSSPFYPMQYTVSFYLDYLANWPAYQIAVDAPNGQTSAYSACLRHAAPAPPSPSPMACIAPHFVASTPVDDAFVWLRCAAVIGKAEGSGTNWHGHVSAVSVAPQFRRLGIARVLMKELERISEHVYVVESRMLPIVPGGGQLAFPQLETYDTPCMLFWTPHFWPGRYNAFFVDLFVRVSNVLAISMYQRLGYVVYRQVLLYYSGEEDAYGTRALRAYNDLSGRTPARALTVSPLCAFLFSHFYTGIRHAESPSAGPREAFHDPPAAPGHCRRGVEA